MKRLIALALLGAITWAAVAYEHGWAHFLGIDTQQSQNYDFVSGVGPMIVTLLVSGGIFVTLIRHVNCHAPGCWRLGKFPLAGGQFKVCRRHHPDEEVRTGRNDLLAHIWAQHHAHRQLEVMHIGKDS